MRKFRIATALALAGVLALTGCTVGTQDVDTTSAEGEVRGTLTFQTWNLRATYRDYFEGLIADFEKKYPGTHVKWVDQPAEGYADKISADAAGGTLPDVVNVSPDLVAPLAKARLALDLDSAAPRYRDEYLPSAWRSSRIPGMKGTYAFPWYLNTGPLFYNKRLFRQAGLDPEDPPRTYGELFDDALRMARRSKGRVATLASVPTIEDFGRYGVRLMNRSGTAFTFDEPKGVELLERYKKLYEAGALDAQAFTSTPEQAGRKFMQQSVAMNPGSALDLDKFKKEAPRLYENIGITDAPDNTGRPNMYVQGLMVNAAGRNKATAVAFAHFVTNARNQMAFAHQTTVFPSTRGALETEYFTKQDGTDRTRVRVATAASLEKAVNYTPVLMSDDMKTALQNAVTRAVRGDEPPGKALGSAAKECNRLLEMG
ncbi:extracellular solute-binding protein [Streptomyces albus subsp. chlorinus]|uniref:extracellular solute-binding protein n=1 Tax=Streptomyces albus TaxID=1888 RepID=UPI00156FC51E|nr:extracellular solute-binding protein [Streptomyces albus subsp. chlorinus]